MSSAAVAAPDVLISARDGVGHIALNRPRAINALNHGMVRVIHEALDQWSSDHTISTIVLSGSGDRGFCAGGDIRAIYDDVRTGGRASLDFWRDEYRLNALIARYPKPVVALMDGLVMGGGVGLSAHASHRVVTDRSIVAMPEVNIGLIPDVGGTYLLGRAPGWLGLHAALTGVRLDGADVIAIGLADYYVDHSDFGELVDNITVHGVEQAIYGHASPVPVSRLAAQRIWIDECYNAESAVTIVERLKAVGNEDATVAADAISAASPTSVTVTLKAVRSVRHQTPTLEQALNQEFRMVSAAAHSADLVEGIRAQVIDKDRNPRWTPASLAEVSEEEVRRYFAPTDALPFEPVSADFGPAGTCFDSAGNAAPTDSTEGPT